MEATRTYKKRTREEIMEWWRQAKDRKQAWEREMQKMFAEEDVQR